MSKAEDTEAFTIRPPISLGQKVRARALLNHRSRSAEAVHLIEWAIDEQAKRLLDEQARVRAASEQHSSG